MDSAKGWHRIADDLDHTPGWVEFAVDRIVQGLGNRLRFEHYADAQEEGGD